MVLFLLLETETLNSLPSTYTLKPLPSPLILMKVGKCSLLGWVGVMDKSLYSELDMCRFLCP